MPHKLLLVEDNEMNRDMLSRRLIRRGYEVIMAADGLTGIKLAEQELPALVMLDVNLPDIDGWEVARRLKQGAGTKAIPIIALTAHAMPEDRNMALDCGCDDYDIKPIDLARLVKKIEGLISI